MQKFEPTWESLQNYRTPDWYLDGKFGIFIHWGLYAVPAFGNEWYPRNMYLPDTPEYQHHLATYGPPAQFGYKDFIPLFKAEHYDPDAWAHLFKEAGARFVVPVAEHHDGFAMYDCGFSPWNAVQMGPHRDLIGDLAQAVRQQGLIFGLSTHRAEHWWFMNGGRGIPSDVQDERFQSFYGPATITTASEWKSLDWQPRPHALFLEDWLGRTCELVDKYQPQLVWFDWWIEQIVFKPYLQRFAAYYYNRGLEWQKGVAINYKNDAFPVGTAVYDVERGQLKDINPRFWQTDTSISTNSWGYVHNQNYKTAGHLIGDLVDIVSKNGALLLNVGPRPDGTIPEAEQAILRQMGSWLSVNGEAIYGTRPWKVFGEGPVMVEEGSFSDMNRTAFTSQDLRFTCKGQALYAICLGWPDDRSIYIHSLAPARGLLDGSIQKVSLLGSSQPVAWRLAEAGLQVTLPGEKFGEYAWVLRIDYA